MKVYSQGKNNKTRLGIHMKSRRGHLRIGLIWLEVEWRKGYPSHRGSRRSRGLRNYLGESDLERISVLDTGSPVPFYCTFKLSTTSRLHHCEGKSLEKSVIPGQSRCSLHSSKLHYSDTDWDPKHFLPITTHDCPLFWIIRMSPSSNRMWTLHNFSQIRNENIIGFFPKYCWIRTILDQQKRNLNNLYSGIFGTRF